VIDWVEHGQAPAVLNASAEAVADGLGGVLGLGLDGGSPLTELGSRHRGASGSCG
jgi:hypothetical protein